MYSLCWEKDEEHTWEMCGNAKKTDLNQQIHLTTSELYHKKLKSLIWCLFFFA